MLQKQRAAVFFHLWTTKLDFNSDCSLWASTKFIWVQNVVGAIFTFGKSWVEIQRDVCSVICTLSFVFLGSVKPLQFAGSSPHCSGQDAGLLGFQEMDKSLKNPNNLSGGKKRQSLYDAHIWMLRKVEVTLQARQIKECKLPYSKRSFVFSYLFSCQHCFFLKSFGSKDVTSSWVCMTGCYSTIAPWVSVLTLE